MKVLVASVAAVVLLAGCSSGGKKSSAPKLCDAHCQSNLAEAEGSTLASVVPGVTIDDVSFLSVERTDFPASTDKQIIQIGHDVCELWRVGDTFADIVALHTQHGLTGKQSGWLIGNATTFYCPQYRSLNPGA